MKLNKDDLLRVPKVFELEITRADQRFSDTFELDKNVRCVHGVAFASEKPDLLFHRGYAKLEINKREFFPENHAIQRLMTGVDANLNVRYWELDDVIIGNGMVRLDYQDKSDGRTNFQPYTVQLYLDCFIDND